MIMQIKYKDRQGELALNLDALMPCTIQDFKRVLSFLDLSEDLESHARELHDFMQAEINVLHTLLEMQPQDKKVIEKLKRYERHMKTLESHYYWFYEEEREEKTMKNYEFTSSSIIRNGTATPAGYSVTPKGTVVVITMNESRERIRLEPGDEYYQAALDAANGKEKPESEKVERAETILEAKEVERIETVPEPEEKKDPKQARGPVPEKKFIGETIQGNGWRIYFDGAASRTRVIFDADPSEKVKKIVAEAGFYYSSVMKSWNKKLTFKAYRAAGELAKKLNKCYKNAA